MNTAEIPDALLDVIYDAATEPALWPRALRMIADLTGSQGVLLHGAAFDKGYIGFMHVSRIDEECIRTYVNHHMDNPWTEYMRVQPTGTLVRSEDVVPLTKLRRSAFFADVLRSQQTPYSAMALLFNHADFIGAFSMTRTEQQGSHGEREMRILRQLMPHMQRSINLSERVESYRLLQQANADALDALATGIFLLDAQGDVLFANQAGAQITGDTGALGLRNGRLFARDAASQNAWVTALRTAGLGEPVSAFPISAGRALLHVAIQPVRSADRERLRLLAHRSPAVIVLATPADAPHGATLLTRLLTNVYGLTPAEVRVALPSAQGSSPGAIAEALQLTRNTVKTHLKRVYSKTQVNRQAELMRLLANAAQLPATDLPGRHVPAGPRPQA